jgi:uncharacterized surface protein with fasciclin (FAS1) repeats
MHKRALILVALAIAAAFLAAGANARTERSAAPQKNIVQTAIAAGQFKTLVKLVKRAGLVGALSSQNAQVTVFAPTDAAFARLPKATLNMLLQNKAKLRTALLYHVVNGRVPAARVTMLTSAMTLARKSVTFSMKDGAVFVNDAKVVKADVGTRNGIIHVINRVLIPGS